MGNKMGTFLIKRKLHKKDQKLGSSENALDDDDQYFTPKSYWSDPKDENQPENQDLLQVLEMGQSSIPNGPTFVCEICVEPSSLYDSFNVQGCTHFYCTQCMIKYIASKLEDNVTHISCPVLDCEGVLEPEHCRLILPKDVFDKWGNALCESVVIGSLKFYCPYTDCSALLINEEGGEGIKKLECPYCRRMFCFKCKVPWHEDIDCAKFQKLKKRGGERMMTDLAKRKKWRKCPKCKYYIEKSSGCFYIRCRCGYAFCYNCGACSSATSHVCPSCKH